MPARLLAVCAVLAASLVGCAGEGAQDTGGVFGERGSTRVTTTRVELVTVAPTGTEFDPQAIYERGAPGVVTVISLFDEDRAHPDVESGRGDGVGSGFVLSRDGEVVTNAHVVSSGEGAEATPAREVYIEFADGNKVRADVVGHDFDTDVALLEVDPSGLTLRPLPLGRSARVSVGEPVAAIGSPFGERQSLSIGVVSAVDRSIRSLTAFDIPGAIQTDAAINPGNSGGPLVNARGQVIGINQQIKSTTGSGEGVGFAVPVDVVKRSIRALRADGAIEYGYLGVATVELYPQLVERFDLPVDRGAWVQNTADGGPASQAGLQGGGDGLVSFQGDEYAPGGDVITRLGRRRVADADDLAIAVGAHAPGERVTLELWRDGRRQEVAVTLGRRPTGGRRLP